MAKVFGLHEIELRPGVKAEVFEAFFTKEVATATIYPGWQVRLLKADRGVRAGKYLVMYEVESVETRDRYYPSSDQQSEAATQFDQQHPEFAGIFEKWNSLASPAGEIWTDYVVVGG